MQSQLHIDPITLGYIFSAFGWSYVISQLPGGWLLDRFGFRVLYAAIIVLWSLFTLLPGSVGFMAGGAQRLMSTSPSWRATVWPTW